MQTTLIIERDGITAALSFSLHRADESPSIATGPERGTPETLAQAPDQVAIRMATAAAPLLLQAFEQAQTIEEHSQAVLSQLNTAIVKE